MVTDCKDRITASAPFWGSKTILQLNTALGSSAVFMPAYEFYLFRREWSFCFTGYSFSCASDLLATSEAWNSLPMYSRSTVSFCVSKPFKHFHLVTWEQLIINNILVIDFDSYLTRKVLFTGICRFIYAFSLVWVRWWESICFLGEKGSVTSLPEKVR